MSAKEEKKCAFSWNSTEKREVSGVMKSLWVCICKTSMLRRLVVKQSSLVDTIIELCVKRSSGTMSRYRGPCPVLRISFIARYVCTYEEFVLVTEAPQCDRMTVTRQDTNNKNNNIQYTK